LGINYAVAGFAVGNIMFRKGGTTRIEIKINKVQVLTQHPARNPTGSKENSTV
jgi:hypothetical protein